MCAAGSRPDRRCSPLGAPPPRRALELGSEPAAHHEDQMKAGIVRVARSAAARLELLDRAADRPADASLGRFREPEIAIRGLGPFLQEKFVRCYFAVTDTVFVLAHATLQIVPSGRRAVVSEVSTQPMSVDPPGMMPPLTASSSSIVSSRSAFMIASPSNQA